MKQLFDKVSARCSKLITNEYSTSFSMGVRLLHPAFRESIYNIYGFVRLADEIVDSFHGYQKEKLLNELEEDYYKAIASGISLNPVLNSFQKTVRENNIDDDLIQAFLKSMRRDLEKKTYTQAEYKEYIYGSADAVGLMCLKVFVKGDEERYLELKPHAMRLGSAFQKVNFLRDLKNDVEELHRVYFPNLQKHNLNEETKMEIISEIYEDFNEALKGIRKLPNGAKLGVYTAYYYYRKLLKKIERLPAKRIMEERIRISNARKLYLATRTLVSYELRMF